jgi:hypothetical protein
MRIETIEFIKELGFSPSVALVYWLILSKSCNNVKEIMVNTHLGRSTIVEALLLLEREKLIISRSVKNGRKLYSITNSENLGPYTDKKIFEFQEKQENLIESRLKIGKIFKILDLEGVGFDATTNIYLGKKEILSLYRSTVTQPEIFSICKLEEYYNLFPSGLSLQSQANRLMKSRKFKDLVIGDGSISILEKNKLTQDYSNYEYKLIKDQDELKEMFFSDVLICDTFTIFSNFKEDIPYAIKLNSIEISKFLQGFHQMIWSLV